MQVTAFGFGSGPDALNQATFYRLRVVNRSANRLEDAYLGYWSDPDLGDASDDWTGSDTLRQFAYVYNADNNDGTGTGGTYGPAPPATGVQFVHGPIALPNGRDDNRNGEIDEPDERNGMSSFMYFINGTAVPTNDPANGIEMNHMMRGRWTDGTPLTEGGLGLNPGSNLVTTYAHPGDPVLNRFWSARCPGSLQSCGPSLTPGNWKFVVSTGPFELAPSETDEVLIAVIFGQGSDNFDSVSVLRRASGVVRGAFEIGLLDPRRVPGFAGPPPPPAAVQVRRPAPNPFEDAATMNLSLPAAADVRVSLVDVLGREVAVLAEGRHEAGAHAVEIDGRPLAPGVYVTRVWVGGQPAAAMLVTRR
jgi:hypothetical protein